MATHSGLTRWQDFPLENETRSGNHFGRMHPRAIDEVWYQRAVEQHYVQPDSFVFSVPIDEVKLDHQDTLVTASHAIFIGNLCVKYGNKGHIQIDQRLYYYGSMSSLHDQVRSLYDNITRYRKAEGAGCRRWLPVQVFEAPGSFPEHHLQLRRTGKLSDKL